jgi:hypothetical protein
MTERKRQRPGVGRVGATTKAKGWTSAECLRRTDIVCVAFAVRGARQIWVTHVDTTSLLNPERLPAWDNSRWKPIPSLHLHESEGFLLRKNESGYVTLRWQGEVADDADWSEPLQIEKCNIM